MSTGLRVIAMAKGTSFADLTFCGIVGILDPPRDGVMESIDLLRHSGVQVKMITGDALETARAIATRVGIDLMMKECLSGDELDQMSQHELENIVSRTAIFYRTTPKNKLSIVKALKGTGYIVGMTGDGVNDAVSYLNNFNGADLFIKEGSYWKVALKSADIGIAMGISGTDVSKEAADMILVDDNFNTIM